MTVANWVIIGLIVLLWFNFALNDHSMDSTDTNASLATIKQNRVPQTSGSIEQYHIFGSAQALIDIPLSSGETSLNLVLNGTMSSLDDEGGLAYISNAQGVQAKFLVGEKVFNSATLKEIHKNHVVLQHNGKKERLSLRENNQSVQSTAKKSKSSNAQPAYLKHLNGGEQRNWQEMMNQQKFDPANISNIVSNVNLVTNQSGQLQGLRVSSLADGNLLAQHGLKSNDIITAINGNKISSNNMTTIKQTLEQNPNATVTIKRNGKVQNIQINLKNL